jgi:hypothetical protein
MKFCKTKWGKNIIHLEVGYRQIFYEGHDMECPGHSMTNLLMGNRKRMVTIMWKRVAFANRGKVEGMGVEDA